MDAGWRIVRPLATASVGWASLDWAGLGWACFARLGSACSARLGWLGLAGCWVGLAQLGLAGKALTEGVDGEALAA